MRKYNNGHFLITCLSHFLLMLHNYFSHIFADANIH
jgi:hypothetical protein